MSKYIVSELEMITNICPTQWEGRTLDGLMFYARYRWGGLSVDIGGNQIFYKNYNDPFHGVMSTNTMMQLTSEIITYHI